MPFRARGKEIINSLSSVESVHANMLTKLWENPDPTSAFAAQNISLASDDYDFLFIVYRGTYNSLLAMSTITAKGGHFTMTYSYGVSGVKLAARNAIYQSDTSYSVADAQVSTSSTTAADNQYIIPFAVYGFKKSLDITAIVSNVSTDARQCMLSDGATSVEDRVGDTNVYKFFNDKVVVTKIGNVVTANFYGADSTAFKSGTSFVSTTFLDNYPKLKPTASSALSMGLLFKDDNNNYPAIIEVITSGKVSISYKNAINTRTYSLSDSSFRVFGTISWINE